MKLPESLLVSLEDVKGFDRATFVQVHENEEQVTSVRINPAKIAEEDLSFVSNNRQLKDHDTTDYNLQHVPWSQYGFYLNERPSFTFDPLFHAGCYYVQEASSMFLEQALLQLADGTKPLKVLDLCAAPGGKSTHIQSLLSPESLLVSNEVIRSRSHILVDNIIKWGTPNVVVTNNDSAAFKKLGSYFDIMVVDAPCSGSGLFRRDEEAINEWSLNNVALCAQRQKRILADALPALKENGILIYSTCSYSKDEDEDIADWLVQEMGMENKELQLEEAWKIIRSESPGTRSAGYRFYPDKVKGEGFFLSCFIKRMDEGYSRLRPVKVELATAQESAAVMPYLANNELKLIRNAADIIAIPERFYNDIAELKSVLNIVYSGTRIGQIMKNKLVPDHALALSLVISDNIPIASLSYEDAIRYLQRQDMSFKPETIGWQVVRFKDHNLGWINALSNRINNYYPKELRILKQSV